MAPLDGFNLELCAQVAPLVENKHWWSFFSRAPKLYKCDSEDADIHKPWSPPPSVARANISLFNKVSFPEHNINCIVAFMKKNHISSSKSSQSSDNNSFDNTTSV